MISQHSPECCYVSTWPKAFPWQGHSLSALTQGAVPACPAAAGCFTGQAAAALQGMAPPAQGLALQGQ